MAEPTLDQTIAKEWLGFEPEKRQRLMSKMTAEQKSNLRRALESQGAVISGPPTGMDKVKSSFFTGLHRAGDTVRENLPTIGATVGALVGAEAGPPGAVAGAALGGAAGRAAQQIGEFGETGKAQPGSTEAAIDIGKSGAEQGLYEVGGMGIAKIGKLIKPVSRGAKLSYAAGGGGGERILNDLVPDFDKTLKTMGSRGPRTIGEFEQVIQATNTRLENEYAQAIQPIAGQQVVPVDVANAIRAQITPSMLKTAEGRAIASRLQKRALEFENQTWSIRDLDAERSTLAKKLRTYHNAAPSSAAAKARLNAELMADKAANDKLNEMLYQAADRSAGKRQGYFAALKKKQSQLIDLTDDVKVQKRSLEEASAKNKGAPVSEKLHSHGYMHPTSGRLGATGSLNPAKFGDPLKRSGKAVESAFPGTVGSLVRSVREGTGTALSNADINALPIRALFDFKIAPPREEKPRGQQKKDIQAIREKFSSNPLTPAGVE